MQIFGVPKGGFFLRFSRVFLGSKTFRVPLYGFFFESHKDFLGPSFWGTQEFLGDPMRFGEGPPQQIFGVAKSVFGVAQRT